MPTLKQMVFASLLGSALLATAAAQDSTNSLAQRTSLTITASAAGERVRIAAPSSVVQMHVEVYAANGEKLFDQEIRGGNVFDWHLQDGQAQRLAPGDYVCVVTAKSVSGKLTQKIGAVNVEENSVNVQPAESPKLSVQQTQAIGPVEENSSWTIPEKDEPQTPTVIANDGTDGQMIRGRGALTFRIGNFFSGIDTEQMRLTEDGRLGIGTSTPQSTLDVAGTIRAERFLIARPNTSAGDIKAQAPEAADSVQPLIAGTGTLNRIAKWTPDGSTLGDSAVTETAGFVGIGTPTPTQALEVANGRIITTGSQTLAAAGGILEIGTTLTNNNNAASGIRMRNTLNGNASIQQALDVAPTFAPSASISLARGFISTAFFAPPAGVTITDAYGGNANTVYNNTSGAVTNGTAFAIRSPIVFGALKPTNQYGLHILNQGIGGTTNSYGLYVDAQSGSGINYSAIFAGGNVGIGTTNPAASLHVAGNVLFENKWRTETTFVNPGGVPGPPNLIGGFLGTGSGGALPGNRVTSGVVGATIGGGGFNGSILFPGLAFPTTGDHSNRVTDWFGTVGGGFNNRTGDDSGLLNHGFGATVGGGLANIASGGAAIVGGGSDNIASGALATVGGGQVNLASGDWSTVPGGRGSVALGDDSFAAGRQAKANHQGTFVWADSTAADFASTGNNQFLIRASGGVGIGIGNPSGALHINAPSLAPPATLPGAENGLLLGTNGTSSYKWIQSYGGDLNLNPQGNNVGIGTTVPDATLTVNGTADKPGGGSWGTFSDERLKTIRGRFTTGLKAVMRLQPLRYEYRRDNALGIKSDGEYIGFGAQAVQKIIPEAVSTNDRGYLLVNNDPILWTMLNAIKEQQQQITQQQVATKQQQDQIAALRTANTALNARLRLLERTLKNKRGSSRQRR